MAARKPKKSGVNAAGNYTKPGMRKNLFNKIKAGTKGGDPGEWSARKAQLLASQYKKSVNPSALAALSVPHIPVIAITPEFNT